MKKLVSLLLAVLMIFQIFTLVISAAPLASEDLTEEELMSPDEDMGEIHSCTYLPKDDKVVIKGSINHEIMVTHNEYKIALFSLQNGEKLYDKVKADGVKPLASADISIKFEFEVSTKTLSERFARYAVVIYNSQGDVKAVDEPKFPNVASKYESGAGDKRVYKGISTSQSSVAVSSGVGTAVIPVYIEKLFTSATTGYLYSLQGSYIYFDKAYVGELDARVKSLSAVGSKVYLQFLISRNSESGIPTLNTVESQKYTIPDMSSEQAVTLISAFTDFLCSRYAPLKGGGVHGIILGSSVDTAYEGSGLSEESFSADYAYYMMVAGTVAREIIPSVDIVLPLSDRNSYESDKGSELLCRPSLLTENICGFFDKYCAEEFSFSTMIESSSIPYGISDEAFLKGEFSSSGYDGINADNANIYADYLSALSGKYDNSPASFIFFWDASGSHSGNVISTAYAYSYFKLMANNKISAFAVSFAEEEKAGDFGGLAEISKIMKYIDTSDSFAITEPQLKLLGASNWYAVIDDMYSGRFDIRRILKFPKLHAVPADIIGSYTYYDFSYYTSFSEWFGGESCETVKIDYSDVGGRTLQAHFDGKLNSPGEFSELYCSYEYPENFVYTPYMQIKLNIENDSRSETALYEIYLTFGSGKNVSELTQICRAYENVSLIFDISEYSEISMADYVKIGIRSLTGEDGGYTLCLSSMSGYSLEYTSGELSNLITQERLNIRDMLEDDTDNTEKEQNMLLFVAGIAIVIAVIGVGIFMCFRREEEESFGEDE